MKVIGLDFEVWRGQSSSKSSFSRTFPQLHWVVTWLHFQAAKSSPGDVLWQLQAYLILNQATAVGKRTTAFPTQALSGQVQVPPLSKLMGVSKDGKGGYFHLNTERWLPKGRLSFCFHSKGNGCWMDESIYRCLWQLHNLGHFFATCMAFPLLPAPLQKEPDLFTSYSIKLIIVLWNER